jgi:hypothetical protein
VNGYPTPEEAATAADSVPRRYVNIVAVDYSPRGSHAVVLIAYNEPPDLEPYIVLCQKTPAGWVERQGGSGGGVSWISTAEDGSLGARTTWEPPTVEWDVPARERPELPDEW